MLTTYERGRERELHQLGELIVLWLECLHPDGWLGSASELHELQGEAGPRQRIPVRQGLSGKIAVLSYSLAAAGWRVRWGRTSAGRFIAFERAHDDDDDERNTRR
jgi:hypothetical protein